MKVKLCDVCERKSSNLKQSEIINKNGDYPIYGATGYLGNVDFYHIEKPYVAVIKDGAGIGRTTLHPGKSSIIGTMQYLIPKEGILPEYLYYVVKYMHLEKYYTGATIPHIYFKDYKNEEFNFAPFEKQKKIVECLKKVENIIDDQQTEIKTLESLIKARFVEMFGDPQINEKGFTKASMGEYLSLLTDFSSNGSYKALDSGVTMYDEPNYAWMVRTTDLESGDMSSIKYIDKKAYELLSKSKIFGGEIIMNKIGSAGKIYIMPKLTMPASLGRNAFMFRYDERINNIFMYYLLTSDYGQREIQQYVRGAVTKTITKDDARSVLIIVPPLELQQQFAGFVQQVDKSKLAVQQSLKKTQLLFDSLMQEYFGEN